MAENENRKKNTYNYESQKKYNEKNVVITMKFIHSEKEFLQCLESACNSLEISRQAYIKTAIREKLERDGFLNCWNDEK